MSNILYTHPVVTTVKNWCWPLEDDEGRRIVCRPNGRLSQRWFITGTVTECSWQRGHGSPPHRQTGHCYLAGRSGLSLLISTVTPDESTTHQRISAQPGEKACARLSFHTVSWFQSWCQSEEGFLQTCVHFVQSDSMMYVPTSWSFSAGDSKLVCEPGMVIMMITAIQTLENMQMQHRCSKTHTQDWSMLTFTKWADFTT